MAVTRKNIVSLLIGLLLLGLLFNPVKVVGREMMEAPILSAFHLLLSDF